MGSILFSFILLIVFLYFLKTSVVMEDLREVDTIGASGIPTFVLTFIILLLVISIIKEFTLYMKNKEDRNRKLNKKSLYTLIFLTLLIFIFIFVLKSIGFFISSLVFTPLLLFLLGEKNILRIALLSIFISLGFTFLFGNILNIPLPRGNEIFVELSRFIY